MVDVEFFYKHAVDIQLCRCCQHEFLSWNHEMRKPSTGVSRCIFYKNKFRTYLLWILLGFASEHTLKKLNKLKSLNSQNHLKLTKPCIAGLYPMSFTYIEMRLELLLDRRIDFQESLQANLWISLPSTSVSKKKVLNLFGWRSLRNRSRHNSPCIPTFLWPRQQNGSILHCFFANSICCWPASFEKDPKHWSVLFSS